MEIRTGPANATERAVQEILSWRRDRLCAAGFAPALADEIARDERYDPHELIDLVERGCPPVLAIRILAPLDEEVHAA